MTATAGLPAPPASRRRRPLVALVLGSVLLGLVILLSASASFWLPFPLDDTSGAALEPPGAVHPLGTDEQGRDLASLLLVAIRTSLVVGVGAGLLAVLLGLVVGLAAAFASGWRDEAAASALDIAVVVPPLLFALLIVANLPPGVATVTIAIGIASAAVLARFARQLGRSLLRQQFVVAAQTSGTGWPRIIADHLLPNLVPAVLVTALPVFGGVVLGEAALSYLGLGVPSTTASLGRLLRDGQLALPDAPLRVVVPGLALTLIVLGANLLADGLRHHLDPLRRHQ